VIDSRLLLGSAIGRCRRQRRSDQLLFWLRRLEAACSGASRGQALQPEIKSAQ